jgi:hypothetical protein
VIWLIVSSAVGGLLVGQLLILMAGRTKGWTPRWSVNAARQLELKGSPADVLARAGQALEELDLVGAPAVENGSIEAEVPRNWRTMGNTITVRVVEGEAGTTVALVSSRPVFPQRFDWGRSRLLVDAVASCLADSA